MLTVTVKGHMASKRVGQQGIQKRCVDLVTVDTVQYKTYRSQLASAPAEIFGSDPTLVAQNQQFYGP